MMASACVLHRNTEGEPTREREQAGMHTLERNSKRTIISQQGQDHEHAAASHIGHGRERNKESRREAGRQAATHLDVSNGRIGEGGS
jgi:hypothetical protein